MDHLDSLREDREHIESLKERLKKVVNPDEALEVCYLELVNSTKDNEAVPLALFTNFLFEKKPTQEQIIGLHSKAMKIAEQTTREITGKQSPAFNDIVQGMVSGTPASTEGFQRMTKLNRMQEIVDHASLAFYGMTAIEIVTHPGRHENI